MDSTMGTVTVQDPETYTKKSVDGSGKLYLGRDYAGKQVKFIVETVEEKDE